MQGKVSMIMPCYNKVKYICEMFDSIIAQDWNNIELILVNDGSTDGTRGVITEYEPKFRARGFDVIIIDQENAGVCAAAKAGLERITGDYACMVDSDDELDPKYVSTMAGWLEENPECDFAACERIIYTGSGREKVFKDFNPREISDTDHFLLERFLLTKITPTVWIYMVKVEYLKKCRVIETYFVTTRGSHEPGYIIPLLSFGGKLKFFPLPLYRFNVSGEGHSQFKRFEQARGFYIEYDRLCKKAINCLPDTIADQARKEKLFKISTISKNINLFKESKMLSDGHSCTDSIFNELLDSVNSLLSVNPPITREQTSESEAIFILAITNLLLGQKRDTIDIPMGRIIGYGAFGKAAAKLLPCLKKSRLKPTELWDIAGDGVKVKKPDFDSLNKEDLVLVFPTKEIESELKERFAAMPFRVLYNSDLQNRLADEFYDKYLKDNNWE